MLSDANVQYLHERCCRDLRQSLPDTSNSIKPITSALVSHLPFPNGVVPKFALRQLGGLRLKGIHWADHGLAHAWANGAAIDSLVILLRLFLALGLDWVKHGDPMLYEVAFQDCGRSIVHDYVNKGRLFDALYPLEHGTRRIDATLGELIHHPLVNASLWTHPNLQFFQQRTWAKKPGKPVFEPYDLSRELAHKSHPFPFEFEGSGPPDLRKFFSRLFGLHTINSKDTNLTAAFACRMPPILPVIIKGGHKFNRMRSFLLEAPVHHHKQPDGTLKPVMKRRPYHLRAVVNLADSDIRLYHQDTTPVVEKIRPQGEEDKPAEYFKSKLLRGEHAKGWTFEEGSLQYFMLVYAKYADAEGGPYKAPSEEFGEFLPPQ